MKKLVFLGVACAAIAGTVSPDNAHAQQTDVNGPTDFGGPAGSYEPTSAEKLRIGASGSAVARAGLKAWSGDLTFEDRMLIAKDAQMQIAAALLRGDPAALTRGLHASGVPEALAENAATSFAALRTNGKGMDVEYSKKLRRAISDFNSMVSGVSSEVLVAAPGQLVGMQVVLKQVTEAYNQARPAKPIS
jgi:hypothetical protein